MNDEKLASTYRLAEPPSPHLTEEAWEALVDGTLSASDHEAAQDHVTRCEACATMYQGLLMFERESRELGAPGRSVSRFRAPLGYWPASIAAMQVMWRGLLALQSDAEAARLVPPHGGRNIYWLSRPVMRLAMAATLVAALGIGASYWLRSDGFRAGEPVSTVRGVPRAALDAGRPSGIVAGDVTFEWSARPDANAFVVVVYREDGSVRWTSRRVTGTALSWPSDPPLAPGRYFWRVRAYRDDEVLAESPLTSFEIR
jgi:hypothetical protein